MGDTVIIVYIFIAGIVLLGLYIWTTYNSLVSLRVRVNEAWSDIDVQMRRRYDLIPNLVETVKGYAKHESGTLERVIEARNKAMATTGSAAEQAAAENVMTGALRSLFALAESYPDLKANQNFLSLQQQLAEIEDKIQASRRFYNGTVRLMNTKVQQFPGNLVARQFGFTRAEFFEIDEAEAEAVARPVKVEF